MSGGTVIYETTDDDGYTLRLGQDQQGFDIETHRPREPEHEGIAVGLTLESQQGLYEALRKTLAGRFSRQGDENQ